MCALPTANIAWTQPIQLGEGSLVVTIRTFHRGDEQLFLRLANTAYRNLEILTSERVKRLTSPPYFNRDGFFIAEKEGAPVGCVGAFNLRTKGYLWIGYLAVEAAFSNLPIVNRLMKAALKYCASKNPTLLKAVTPMIQPYVDAYKRFGFRPARRILRIAWDPINVPRERSFNQEISVVEVSRNHVEEASHVLVQGLRPYWDWWLEEEGGIEAVLERTAKWMKQSACLMAKSDNRAVGVTGIVPHPEVGKARFLGVIVLPNFRKKGIGSALMYAVLNKAKQLGYKRLVVHTMAYLDALAPGAVLYLKSGGKIEAEYLHLLKES
jgi:GNAT superfamily N-acetyltransferase